MAKQIFISHSSRDKIIVDVIVETLEHYLNNGKTITNYDTTYTSSDKKEYRFKLASNIGDKSILLAGKSDIFIAYISEDYKDSEICMAELGCGFYNHMSRKKDFIFIPIKDDYVNFNDLTFLLNNRTVLSRTFNNIIKFFNSEFNTTLKPNVLKSLKTKFELIYKGIDHDLIVARTDIKNFASRTFTNTHPLKSNTFIQYVSRKLYTELHIDLAEFGEEELIWSSYKSPLLIKVKLLTNNLTAWDSAFFKVNSNRKKRLIIFDSTTERDSFFKSNSARKKAFVAANKTANSSFLYYTVKHNLFKEYNRRHPKNTINFNTYNHSNELYLEFAFIKSVVRNLQVMMFSDYDNSNSTIQKDTEPLVFIDPTDNDSKYPKKISDSLHLNKMISYRFDELVTDNIIFKI